MHILYVCIYEILLKCIDMHLHNVNILPFNKCFNNNNIIMFIQLQFNMISRPLFHYGIGHSVSTL